MLEGSQSLDSNRRLEGIQFGRGVAASLVVLGHAPLYILNGACPPQLSLLGIYGVTLFFVISGFIMVRTTGKATFSPSGFMARRLERIVPLYYIVMGIGIIQALIAPQLFKTTTLEFWHVARSFLFIPGYSPSFPGQHVITPFFKLGWTLNFEMFFYVVFAALFWLPAKGRVVALTALFCALSTLGHFVKFDAAIPAYYTRIELLGFVTGAWLGLWHLYGSVRLNKISAAVIAAVSLAMIYMVVESYTTGFVNNIPARLCMIGAATLHVWIMLGYLDRSDVKVPYWGRYLGDASYSLYLFHMFGIGVAAAIARKVPGYEHSIAFIALAFVLGTVAGLMAYHFVETPILNWFKRRRKSQTQGHKVTLQPATNQT